MKHFPTGAYRAPQLRELGVRVEAGFATSATIDGVTSMDGVWDEDNQ
ncbi:MAG: hypothetical protein J6J22_02560 [Alistipes sp.]|jgi:hypothetical protein|nr:hypothetical protein [Alistipes sp.]